MIPEQGQPNPELITPISQKEGGNFNAEPKLEQEKTPEEQKKEYFGHCDRYLKDLAADTEWGESFLEKAKKL